jgi:hypothetical protein
MSTLAKLRLVASKKQRTASPVVQRRNKLVNKIHEQVWPKVPLHQVMVEGLVIEHHGYTMTVMTAKNKQGRNLKLVKECVERDLARH